MGIGTASFNRKLCLRKRQGKKAMKNFSLSFNVQHIVVLKNLWGGQEPRAIKYW